MLLRTTATAAAGAIVLAVLGAVTGPAWDPAPVPDVPVVRSSSTEVRDGDGSSTSPAGRPRRHLRRRPRPWSTSSSTARSCRRRSPSRSGRGRTCPRSCSCTAPAPASTSGPSRSRRGRWRPRASSRWCPTSGSTPTRRVHRDYVGMAADYARSVDVAARAGPGWTPTASGSTARARAAGSRRSWRRRTRALAFVVLVSAPVVPPRQQAAFAADSYLRNTDVPRRRLPGDPARRRPGVPRRRASSTPTSTSRRTSGR